MEYSFRMLEELEKMENLSNEYPEAFLKQEGLFQIPFFIFTEICAIAIKN